VPSPRPNSFYRSTEESNEEISIAIQIWKKGSDNIVVDALYKIGAHFHVIPVVVPLWVQEVTNSYHNDPTTTTLL
jgi:hypothetical protein